MTRDVLVGFVVGKGASEMRVASEKHDKPDHVLFVGRRRVQRVEQSARGLEGIVDVVRQAEPSIRAVAESHDGAPKEQRLEADSGVDRGDRSALAKHLVRGNGGVEQPNLRMSPKQGPHLPEPERTDLERVLLDGELETVRQGGGDMPDERELVLPLRRSNRDLGVETRMDRVEDERLVAEPSVGRTKERAAGALPRVAACKPERVEARRPRRSQEVMPEEKRAETRDLAGPEREVARDGELNA